MTNMSPGNVYSLSYLKLKTNGLHYGNVSVCMIKSYVWHMPLSHFICVCVDCINSYSLSYKR